ALGKFLDGLSISVIKFEVISAPESPNIIPDIATKEFTLSFGVNVAKVYVDADGSFFNTTTVINAIPISNIAGTVEPRAPRFVNIFAKDIPLVEINDNTQNKTKDVRSTNILLSAKLCLPIT
ncbi:hypothetical protein KW823_25195, partial [Enterobacter quasiroggenkampii]|nr:hypothetical protein [Enterobacter quasiroggenkampii]